MLIHYAMFENQTLSDNKRCLTTHNKKKRIRLVSERKQQPKTG